MSVPGPLKTSGKMGAEDQRLSARVFAQQLRDTGLVLDAELAVNGADVVAHGVGGQSQVTGDLLVGLAFTEALGDLVLARAEGFQWALMAPCDQEKVTGM